MTILFMASSELRTTDIFSWIYYTSVSSDYSRNGTYSFKASSTSLSGAIFSFNAVTEGYIKIAVKNSSSFQLIFRDIGSVVHLTLKIYNNYLILYRSTGTKIDEAVYPLQMGFKVIEVHWLINDSTGVCQVKVNGVQYINFSGDTRNAGVASVSSIRFQTDSGVNYYFDDIVVRDDTWPGRGGVYVLKPNAGSTNENWTASAGNPEDCVDDIPVSYTDYVSTSSLVDGTEHLFGIESLPYTTDSIAAVGVFCNAKVTAASNAYIHTMLKANVTTDLGSDVGIDTSEQWLITYYDVNPDDSAAWEGADIDALEIGIETSVP